jgi:hypothetical protein
MLNADKYTSKDKDTKLVEAIKSKDLQSKDIFQKYWKEEASKEYFYKSESVKALAAELKGMNSEDQKAYLTKKGITSMDKQNEIREFISTDK